MGWLITASARDQAASQPSSTRPMISSTGGQSYISSLAWRHTPMPPAGCASPSRTMTSAPPASSSRNSAGSVATSMISASGTSIAGRRPMASLT
jgi:hypothetical protein